MILEYILIILACIVASVVGYKVGRKKKKTEYETIIVMSAAITTVMGASVAVHYFIAGKNDKLPNFM